MERRWAVAAVGGCVAALTAAAGVAGTDRATLGAASETVDTKGMPGLGEAASGSTDVGATGTSPTAGGDVIEGTLDAAAPAAHAVELQAGDAVRIWAVPTTDDMADIADHDEPFADGTSIAIAVDPTSAPDLWSSLGWDPGEASDSFFSDYENEGYDPAAYGFVALYTTSGASNDYNYQLDPPFFSCADRGLGAAEEDGAWAMFISPVATTYQVLVTGLGGYELHVETQAAPANIPADPAAAYPYSGATFEALIQAHADFLVDRTFYPTDELFTDTNQYESEARCLTGVVD